ncbi:hypothetical protein LJC23_07515 [Desulfovibrio sp. OttesenSCG-928-I05]|nr:hypothetical protein [Desulfovibrio sp. OttesenSCG-928-I05]
MRGMSFRQALDAGFEPRDYKNPVEDGIHYVRLDFKIWGKAPILRCFFTDLRDGNKFSLPAVRYVDNLYAGGYYPKEDPLVDFSEPGIEGTIYRICLTRGPRGGQRWAEATPMDDDDEGEDDSGTGVIMGV